MAAKDLSLSYLLDIYGALLSDKQRDALTFYVNEDLSLAEIAENTGISRQGVRDQIKHAEHQLIRYENTLRLRGKSEKIEDLVKSLLASDAVSGDERLRALCEEILHTVSFE